MSFVKKTKNFFGLDGEADPYMEHSDAYYDEPRYEPAPAYSAPRYEEPIYASARPRAARPMPTHIVPVRLLTYSDAAIKVGDPFRDGDAVVFDMSDMHKSEAKRIIDFAAGLCFALRGQMRKLDGRIFALVPESASVDENDLKHAAGLIH